MSASKAVRFVDRGQQVTEIDLVARLDDGRILTGSIKPADRAAADGQARLPALPALYPPTDG